MAPTFGRSISLSPARPSSKPRTPSCHVRSISLPCRSHPLLSHLHDQIRAVRSWAQEPTSVSSGLAQIHALHAALGELLLLPEPQAALRGAAGAADRLLDAFLLLADEHGGFQETALALKQGAAEAQAAVRRRDGARLSSAVRAQRKNEKELARLAATVRDAAKGARPGLGASADEVEIAGALMEAAAASAAASAAAFSSVASVSAAATAAAAYSCKKTPALVCLVKRKAASSSEEEKETAALERLEALEESIGELESGSEKVFRSLVQTRVSLLNIRTPTF